MKYLVFVVLLISSCTSNNDRKKTHFNFLEKQLAEAKKTLEAKKNGDERRFGAPYSDAVKFDKECSEVIPAISNFEKTEIIRDKLLKLKNAANLDWGIDSILKINTQNTLEDLITQTDYSNSDEIIEQINLIDYAYWNSLSEANEKTNFSFDVISVIVKNQVGKEGELFQTEILPVALNVTQPSIVRIGTGYDSIALPYPHKHLIGIIDTLKFNESNFPVYTVENPRKGVYDIPAEIISAAYGGVRGTTPFFIHYEIK